MKLHILSDLHNEFSVFDPPCTEAEIVVLAGDIDLGAQGVAWASAAFAGKDVIYVPGNHEFYFRHLSQTVLAMKEAARGSHVHVLDNDEIVIAGARFLGATLWTDFAVFGEPSIPMALSAVKWAMADFNRNIRYGNAGVSSFFMPEQSCILHRESVRWLRERLAEPFAGPTVVVTHHAPARGSIAPRYRNDLVTAGFASDLEDLMGAMDLWVHGHMHESFDYTVRGTRVLCNPRGYTGQTRSQENEGFDPALLAEVGGEGADPPRRRRLPARAQKAD